MHKVQTALSGAFIPDARGEPAMALCRSVLFFLLFTGFLFYLPVSTAFAQKAPEIAVDNAVIGSPQTTLASLLRLTGVYHELVREEGITHENQKRLKNINQQFEKLFDLREVPPK